MSKEYLIGLDVGTSGVKALAFTIQGKLFDMSKQHYETLSSPVEHDPEIIFNSVIKCLTDLINKTGSRPLAIGICTFLHSLMPADKKINPLGNLRLWNDNRSAATAQILKGSSECNDIYLKTGTPVHPMSPLIKIRHIKDTESELFTKTRYFIGIKEYLLYKLTGNLAIDYSIASGTGLFDSDEKKWYGQSLDWCGIKSDSLAEIADPGVLLKCTINGPLKDIVIVPGLSDGCAANLSSSGIVNTDLTLSLGTSAALRFTDPMKRTDPEGILFSYCLDDKLFVTGGASNNCSNVIDIIARDLNISLDLLNNSNIGKNLSSNEQKSAYQNDSLIYMPWMFGERAPRQLYRPVYGFLNQGSLDTPESKLISVVESIVFNIKGIEEKLSKVKGSGFERLHFGGGLSRYPFVRDILTSVFKLPLVEHESSEGSAIGTAMLTAKVLGLINNYSVAGNWNPEVMEYQPDAQKTEYYTSTYNKFVQVTKDLGTD